MPRLDQLIARNVGLSRSQATKLLRSGGVRRASGEPLNDPKLRISSEDLPLTIVVRGRAATLREHAHLVLHKPLGVVTARRDSRHPTAWALLDGAPLHSELKPVGRLDLDATGLLFWTTEGPRIHALTHPKRAVPRTYHVALARDFRPPPVDEAGVIRMTLPPATAREDRPLHPRIVELGPLDPGDRHPALPALADTRALARIVLRDGAHHEVKRIFAALDSEVLCLARVAHAGFELPRDLGPGDWRLLDDLPRP